MMHQRDREDPAIAAMTMDILNNVLSRADSPSELGTYLTEEIRGLTGARYVLFIQSSGSIKERCHRILSVNPLRKREWAESKEAQRFYDIVHQSSNPHIWRAGETSEAAMFLQQEGFDISLAIPLNVGTTRVGAMLMLGMPDETHLSSVISMLSTLSIIIALVLNNASLYEAQEQVIKERTSKLQSANESLIEREKQVNLLLDKSEESRIILLSILEDQKRAEEKIRKNEEIFRAIAETSPLAIYLSVGIEQKAEYINPTFVKLFGYTLEDVPIITKWWPLAYPDEKYRASVEEEWQRKVRQAIETKSEIEPMEVIVTCKDGSKKNISWGFISIGEQNWAFGLDLTERKKAEQELSKHREHLEELVKERTAALQKSQEALMRIVEDINEKTEELKKANIRLEELDRLKSTFIASMSHELRTPLNSIIGFTGIILQGMSGEISEEQRKQLKMVQGSARHLLDLINDIIDLSKIEAGKLELRFKEFDLSNLIQGVKESFMLAARERGLKMFFEMPESLVISSDERRTKQALLNLVSNAIKFTNQGEVRICVSLVRSSECPPTPSLPLGGGRVREGVNRDSIEISVSDTGIGIREEDMDKIFKTFSRIHVEGMPRQEGTGLGLYISKKIAELLGGEIKAESKFGKGSRFTLILPIEVTKVS